MNHYHIAVLLPCFNEAGAIGDTVRSFQHALPGAAIYVYDNNSTDDTIHEAKQAGALVFRERRQGKGEVVKRMFADVEADIYVLADGDNTYDANAAPTLIQTLLDENLDMVTGTRSISDDAYPTGHIIGNRSFSALISLFFQSKLNDVFSGYRIMSRRFVKSVPVLSNGFEIETELSVHALHHRLATKEVSTLYRARPTGTASKLNTFRDGLKILNFILFLLRDVKPLAFFTSLSLFSAFLCLAIGVPVIVDFFATGLVERFPSAILASALGVISVLCLFTGLILDNVSRGRLEEKNLRYLAFPSVKGTAVNLQNKQPLRASETIEKAPPNEMDQPPTASSRSEWH
ncbi:glycosyltransferase family 2 protein [Thaumasiovibrio subtropicus]|uniref:glycosyltransferase family 2 protein n=1 Tax=Thaumasiovibrio subtropicus TaxID=1891207 RepID=UPI000B354565|nr:glycosyltransferase family 2 protein [Thaumasiovibrio subtropicus]